MLKIKIDVLSLFQKSSPKIKDDFAIYLVNGYQGTGKTWFAVYDAYKKWSKKKIKTNIQSLKIPGFNIEYFTKLSDIYNDTEDNVVYIIDELSKKYNKNSSLDRDFYSWLQQSRKHSRYVYMITQEYINVPNWLRGVANKVFTTSKVPFLNLFCTTLGVPELDKETFEWTSLAILKIYYKRTKKISNMYDTFESINSL